MNTWPNGIRRSLTQSEHEQYNASHYPGTRQLCVECGDATGRCEEDSIYLDDHIIYDKERGPFCEQCYDEIIKGDISND